MALSSPAKAKWGEWVFHTDNLTIRHASRGHEIDLEQINSTAKMLDWIFHYQGRLGPSVADLIAAFAEIFRPCANCCSFGREKAFSGSDLAKAHRDRLSPKPKRRHIRSSHRYRVLERAGFSCQACGARANDGVKLHVDHIHPVSKGGTNDLSNLQCLCQACNLGKADRIHHPVAQDSIEDLAEREIFLLERDNSIWERFLRVYGEHWPSSVKVMKDHVGIVQLASHEVVLDVRPAWGPFVQARLDLVQAAFEMVLGGSASVLIQGD